jgi:hypothetical protein
MPVSISGEWMKTMRISFDVRALASDYGLQRGFREIGGKIARRSVERPGRERFAVRD